MAQISKEYRHIWVDGLSAVTGAHYFSVLSSLEGRPLLQTSLYVRYLRHREACILSSQPTQRKPSPTVPGSSVINWPLSFAEPATAGRRYNGHIPTPAVSSTQTTGTVSTRGRFRKENQDPAARRRGRGNKRCLLKGQIDPPGLGHL